jgi:hypothetical protein
MALAVMVLITLLVDTISGRVRRRIIRGPQRAVDIGADVDQPGAEATSADDDGTHGDPRTFAPI